MYSVFIEYLLNKFYSNLSKHRTIKIKGLFLLSLLSDNFIFIRIIKQHTRD